MLTNESVLVTDFNITALIFMEYGFFKCWALFDPTGLISMQKIEQRQHEIFGTFGFQPNFDSLEYSRL